MKKALLLLAICFAAAGIVRAQSNNNILPKNFEQALAVIKADTSVNGLLSNEKWAQKNLLKKYENDLAAAKVLSSANAVYSTMPVVGLSNRDTNTMPVAKLGNADTKYTMLVKRIRIAKPTFTTPLDNQANTDNK